MPTVKALVHRAMRGPGVPTEALARIMPAFGAALSSSTRKRKGAAARSVTARLLGTAPMAITTTHQRIEGVKALDGDIGDDDIDVPAPMPVPAALGTSRHKAVSDSKVTLVPPEGAHPTTGQQTMRIPARFQTVRARYGTFRRGGGGGGGAAPVGAGAAAGGGAHPVAEAHPFAFLLMEDLANLLKTRPLDKVYPSTTLTSVYQVGAKSAIVMQMGL